MPERRKAGTIFKAVNEEERPETKVKKIGDDIERNLVMSKKEK